MANSVFIVVVVLCGEVLLYHVTYWVDGVYNHLWVGYQIVRKLFILHEWIDFFESCTFWKCTFICILFIDYHEIILFNKICFMEITVYAISYITLLIWNMHRELFWYFFCLCTTVPMRVYISENTVPKDKIPQQKMFLSGFWWFHCTTFDKFVIK